MNLVIVIKSCQSIHVAVKNLDARFWDERQPAQGRVVLDGWDLRSLQMHGYGLSLLEGSYARSFAAMREMGLREIVSVLSL